MTHHPSATLNIITKIGPIVLKFCEYAQVDILMMIVHFFLMRCCGENEIKKTAFVMQADDGCHVRDLTARCDCVMHLS